MATLKVTNIKNESFAGDQLYLKTDGKIGIGTGTARQLLHIHEDSTGACNLVFTNTTTGTAAADGLIIGLGGGGDPNGQIWHQETKAIKFGTSDTERFRIHSTGELQIGDSTKTALSDRVLQIGKTDRSATYLEIRSATTGAVGLVFSDGATADNSGYRGTVEYNHNDDSLKFKTAGDDRLYITSTGNVGIDSSSPGCKLVSIQKDASNGNNVILDNWYNANATTTFLKAYRQGGAVGYALQYKDSTTRIRQGTYTNHAMELFTNDNARITIANDGHVVLSNSIAFRNETSADNRLDDYEEGVHTQAPVNANLTLTNNILRYTKIGRLVTVSGMLKPSAVSGSNAVLITLPFTSLADSGTTCGRYTSALMHKFVNIDNSYKNVVGYVGQNEAYWRIYHVGDNLDWHQLTNNDLSTDTEIFFTFTYHTTD